MISIPLNLRGIIAVSIALAAVMLVHIKMNSKGKLEYDKTIGQIVYLDKQLGQLPVRDIGKYRYLEVDGYEYPFEIFVGNESGDFKPKFEQIDDLKLGDTIIVFYYETQNTRDERINRFIQFIDKDEKSFFERGDSSKTIGGFVISLYVLMIIGGFILWRLKKIRF